MGSDEQGNESGIWERMAGRVEDWFGCKRKILSRSAVWLKSGNSDIRCERHLESVERQAVSILCLSTPKSTEMDRIELLEERPTSDTPPRSNTHARAYR